MNKLKNLIYALGISLMIILPGCSDPDDEITKIDYDRLFSPTELSSRVVELTGVDLKWNTVRYADSYTIELFKEETMERIPAKLVEGITKGEVSLTGLEEDTKYWVRVKAVGNDIAESKWVTTNFTTGFKNLYLPIQIGDIAATYMTLRWTAGANVSKIVLTPKGGTAITHTLTASEITAGIAKIADLKPSTEYSVILYDGVKRAGEAKITTLAEGTVFVYPEDDFASMLTEAKDNAAFLLMPGTYTIPTLEVSKKVAIEGASSTDKPILSSTILKPIVGADIKLKNLIFDGTGSTGDQTIVYPEGDFTSLEMDGCIIRNYVKGTLYVSGKTKIENVNITNCIYYDIECNGGDFIDFRKGLPIIFTFKNNTVYNSALARDIFRMDGDASANYPDASTTITIENNTFYKVCDNSGKRILYIRLKNNEIKFNNNIIAETKGYYTNQAATVIVSMSKNNYFNAPNFTASTQTGAQNDTGSSYTTLDPQFEDATNGNFTVKNKNVTVGDPRWIK